MINYNLSNVNLYTENYKNMVEFYSKNVGLKPMNKENIKHNWFGFETGNTTFAIEPESNRNKFEFEFNRNNPNLIQFKALNLNHLKEITDHLERNNIEIIFRLKEMSYGIVTTFLDLDKNLIEILLVK